MANDEVFTSTPSSISGGTVRTPRTGNCNSSTSTPSTERKYRTGNCNSSTSTPSTERKYRNGNCNSNTSTPSTERKSKMTVRKNSQEPDVVKQGYLHIKRPPCNNAKIRFKAWQKKFFILRDMSFDNGLSTLEMYDNQAAYESSASTVEYILDLKNVSNVDSYIESKRFPRAFMVLRSAQAPLVFGTTCDIDKSSWMEAINVIAKKRRFVYSYKDFAGTCGDRRSSLPWQIQYRTNPIYTTGPPPTMPRDSSSERPPTPTRTDGPPTPPRNNSIQSNDSGNNIFEFLTTKCDGVLVKIQPSTSASKHRLVGEFYMNVWPGYIAITTIQSLKERLRWPIEHITKFKSEDVKTGENLVTLEASLSSGPSEGCYLFKTARGRDLIKKVKAAVSNVQYAILNVSTPPPVERQMESAKKKPAGPKIPKNNFLFLKNDFLKEKSLSTPNLTDCKEIRAETTQTVQREGEMHKSTVTYESSTVIHSHGYLELLDEDQNHVTFSDALGKDIRRIKDDLDAEVYPGGRDSGFSDTDDEEARICGTVSSTGNDDAVLCAKNTTEYTEQVQKVIYTEVQTTVDCRPPLPPKACHKNNNIKDAFLDYDEEVKSLPEAPPVPLRQTKL